MDRGYYLSQPVKREAGASPARSRRCKRGVFLLPKGICHWNKNIPGRRRNAEILKSEDLPVVCTQRPRGVGWYLCQTVERINFIRLYVMPENSPCAGVFLLQVKAGFLGVFVKIQKGKHGKRMYPFFHRQACVCNATANARCAKQRRNGG